MLTSSLILFRQIFVICLLSLFVNATAVADTSIAAVNTEHGLAVKGYDPVSYFTTGKPTPGLAQFSTTYNGVIPIGFPQRKTVTASSQRPKNSCRNTAATALWRSR
jgi:hypothetical protein